MGRIESHRRGFDTFCQNGVVHNNRQIVGVAILKAKGLFPSFMLKRHCNCQWFPTGDNPRDGNLSSLTSTRVPVCFLTSGTVLWGKSEQV